MGLGGTGFAVKTWARGHKIVIAEWWKCWGKRSGYKEIVGGN